MTKEEFVNKWNVAFESKEQELEFKAEMILDLDDVINEEQNERLVCPNCDGEGFSGKGTTELLPCLSCFGSGEKVD